MAIDLTKPIDITEVQTAVRAHQGLLTSLDAESAFSVLQHFTPIPGVKDSIALGRTTLAKISHKYSGQFSGAKTAGKIVPRVLTVYPCTMEMDDEPERYRRAYITEVAGGLNPMEHPFEIWLINYGIKCASKELHDVIMTAKVEEGTELHQAFNGVGTILMAEKTATKISTTLGNMIATAEFSRANIGDELLKMFRAMPKTFRDKSDIKMFLSADLGDMYDDWLADQGTFVLGTDAETSDTKYLRNTNHKVELVRLTNLPDNCNLVLLTSKSNICYGYDDPSDFSRLMPFSSGNPYHFTAAGKYVLGFQFVSLDKSELMINDKPLTTD